MLGVGSWRGWLCGGEVGPRDAEDALDGAGVADADLNVGLLAEAGVRVDAGTLHEDAADGIEGWLAGLFAGLVEELDDGAVQIAREQVIATAIFRHLRAGCGDDRLIVAKGFFDGLDAV